MAQLVQWEGFVELVNGSARSIFTKNVLIEMWMDVELTVCTNSAAALEMSSRFGAGKIGHLAVRLLWSQEAVRSKVLTVVKIKRRSQLSRHAQLSKLLGLLPMKKPHSKGGMACGAVPRTDLAGLFASSWLKGTTTQHSHAEIDDGTDKQLVFMIASATFMFSLLLNTI